MSIWTSRVWPLSHRQQEMCRSLRVTGGVVWQISFWYDFWYYKTSWVPMNKLSNSHSSSVQCYTPASAEATSQRGSGELGNRRRRVETFFIVCEVQVSLPFIGKFSFDMFQASVRHRAAMTQTKLILAFIRPLLPFFVKSSAKCCQTFLVWVRSEQTIVFLRWGANPVHHILFLCAAWTVYQFVACEALCVWICVSRTINVAHIKSYLLNGTEPGHMEVH